jgi:hypothetical protein
VNDAFCLNSTAETPDTIVVSPQMYFATKLLLQAHGLIADDAKRVSYAIRFRPSTKYGANKRRRVR